MSTRVFFLNSTATQYGEEELNSLQKFLFNKGILNSVGSSWEDWIANGDLKVSQRGAGANMSVDVSAGWALADTTRNSITFKVFCQSVGVTNLAISSNATGSNRVDAVVLRVSRSATPNTLANNIVTLEVVTGTGTSPLSDGTITTALSNDDFIRLANITVPNSASSIVTGNIADTRVRTKTNDVFSINPQVIEMRVMSSDPTGANLVEGMVWFNSTNHTLNFYNGTSTKQLGSTQGIYNPFVVSAQSSPNMTVAIANGIVRYNSFEIKYTGGNSPTFTVPGTVNQKRIDLLVMDVTGTISIVTGTATTGTPTAPSYPKSYLVLAEIYLRNGGTVIKDTDDSTNCYISKDARALQVTDNYDLFFGDGSDGDVIISTNTTLSANKQYRNLTINSGVILNTAGYFIRVRGTLTINSTGKIDNSGTDGGNGSAGGTDSATPGGSAGVSGAGSAAAPAGGTGGAGLGAAGQIVNGNPKNPSLGVSGVAGGGTSGGTATAETLSYKSQLINNPQNITAGTPLTLSSVFDLWGSSSGATLSGSASSGSGKGGQAGGSGASGGGGGGAGGSGGLIVIYARYIVNNGTISANGGNGGNGGNGHGPQNDSGAAGGSTGGGGVGGVICLAYVSKSGSGTVTVNGGLKGATVGTGPIGNGTLGTDGVVGKIYELVLSNI